MLFKVCSRRRCMFTCLARLACLVCTVDESGMLARQDMSSHWDVSASSRIVHGLRAVDVWLGENREQCGGRLLKDLTHGRRV